MSNNELKEAMKEDAAKSAEDLATQTVAQTYRDKLSQPLNSEDPEIFDNLFSTCHIGNLTYNATNLSGVRKTAGTPVKRPRTKQPQDIYRDTDFRQADMNGRDGFFAASANAAFDKDNSKITLFPPQEYTEQELSDLLAKGDKKRYEYAKGNPFVLEAIKLHEHSHLEDYLYNGQNTLTYPIDIAKADRLTETKAYAVENLYMAHQYSLLKQQGKTTITINNEERPIDSLLEIYPNLKETIQKIEATGTEFDIQNPDHVRAVVATSSEYWHTTRAPMYERQHIMSAGQDAVVHNIFDYVQHNDQAYETVSRQMLSEKVYIGNNVSVDLSSCSDLLDTLSTEHTMEILQDKRLTATQDITYGEIQQLDAYLTNKQNLTDTQDKTAYLITYFENTATRSGQSDDNVTAILLNTAGNNHGTIVYADNLTEKIDENGHHIVSDENGSVDISSPNEIQSQDLPELMKQDRQEHDNALKEKTEELTSPLPTQTEEKSQAPQTEEKPLSTPQEPDKPKNEIPPELLLAKIQRQR